MENYMKNNFFTKFFKNFFIRYYYFFLYNKKTTIAKIIALTISFLLILIVGLLQNSYKERQLLNYGYYKQSNLTLLKGRVNNVFNFFLEEGKKPIYFLNLQVNDFNIILTNNRFESTYLPEYKSFYLNKIKTLNTNIKNDELIVNSAYKKKYSNTNISYNIKTNFYEKDYTTYNIVGVINDNNKIPIIYHYKDSSFFENNLEKINEISILFNMKNDLSLKELKTDFEYINFDKIEIDTNKKLIFLNELQLYIFVLFSIFSGIFLFSISYYDFQTNLKNIYIKNLIGINFNKIKRELIFYNNVLSIISLLSSLILSVFIIGFLSLFLNKYFLFYIKFNDFTFNLIVIFIFINLLQFLLFFILKNKNFKKGLYENN